MKILFVVPWNKSLFGDEKVTPGHPHIGIAYLSAVLKQNNHSIKIFDQGIEKDDDRLFKLIKEYDPDIIGLTAFSYCYKYAFELIQRIKESTDTPLIIGGPHVSAVKAQILNQTKADFAMDGESEISIIKFLDEIQKKKPNLSKVTNLIWRNSKGEIIKNAMEPLIKNVDSIPLPDYEEFEFSKYPYYATKTIPIITSRGCPYNCNYCSVKLSMGRPFRWRTPENVVDEIEHWNKLGFKNFEFNDDCFSLLLDRAEKICDLIVERRLDIKFQLYNGIRVDRVSEVLLRKMKAAGCIFVSYGVESGNQGVINKIGKKITLEQVENAIALTNKVGIKNSANFIIGHPGETYETATETLEFAKRLPASFVNVYNIVPYPGTDLYRWIQENARWIYHPDYVLENIGSRDLKPVFETKEFSEQERIEILKKGYAVYDYSVMTFRLGRVFGTIAYILTRIPPLAEFFRDFALSNKLGSKIYNIITFRSRR